MKLVDLVQFMWYHRTIPADLGWMIFIPIPKGKSDTQRMGILKVLLKVMEAIIDTYIKSAVTFHDAIRVFCARRGTWTTILELNLAQDLASVYQDPLLLVFLDLRKAYDNLDRDLLLKTLEEYRSGPKIGA